MRSEGLDAVVLASGSGLAYFTGAEWGLSERFFGAVITREGDPAWVTPAFEKARALEQIEIGTDVRAWEEHESPSALVASILRERKATRPRRDRRDDAVRVRERDRGGPARGPPGQRDAGHRRLPHDQGRPRAGPHAPRQRDHDARPPRGVRSRCAKA